MYVCDLTKIHTRKKVTRQNSYVGRVSLSVLHSPKILPVHQGMIHGVMSNLAQRFASNAYQNPPKSRWAHFNAKLRFFFRPTDCPKYRKTPNKCPFPKGPANHLAFSTVIYSVNLFLY